MKKKFFVIMFLLFGGLTGCTSENGSKSIDSSSQDSVIESKRESNELKAQPSDVKLDLESPTVIDGIEITLKKMEDSNVISDGKKKTLYSFEVKGKNITSDVKGLGAIDFFMVTEDGKLYSIDDTISNFGDELKPDKEISGKLIYSIDSGKKVKAISYKPADDILASWKIK